MNILTDFVQEISCTDSSLQSHGRKIME